jgi:hypothetical protein
VKSGLRSYCALSLPRFQASTATAAEANTESAHAKAEGRGEPLLTRAWCGNAPDRSQQGRRVSPPHLVAQPWIQMLCDYGCECLFDVCWRARLDGYAHLAPCDLQLSKLKLLAGIVGIAKNDKSICRWNHLLEQFQQLSNRCRQEIRDACEISSWSREARYDPAGDRITHPRRRLQEFRGSPTGQPESPAWTQRR